ARCGGQALGARGRPTRRNRIFVGAGFLGARGVHHRRHRRKTAMTHVALTIAGSEASGGAGAQTDLKTFHQLGTFGSAALTCIVSFDPHHDWAHRFVPVEPQVIQDQIEASTAVHDIDTVKIGMLGTPATIDAVAALGTDTPLKQHILPLATFVTPNHFEALTLSGMDSIESVEDLAEAARRIHETYDVIVLAKGGVVLDGPDAVDVFYDGQQTVHLSSPK